MFILILIATELAILFYAFKMIFGPPHKRMHTPKPSVPGNFFEFAKAKDLRSPIKDLVRNTCTVQTHGVVRRYENLVR